MSAAPQLLPMPGVRSVLPVSYTHLDVYKRQMQVLPELHFKLAYIVKQLARKIPIHPETFGISHFLLL